MVATGELGRRSVCVDNLLISFVGLSVFLCGFLIWNLDNIYCGHFRRWRREIGLPWAILLEGHGWWHLMTGLGMDCFLHFFPSVFRHFFRC